jgi:hypothetical protein
MQTRSFRKETAITVQKTCFSRILREPLLHFLVLGAGLFLLYGYVGDAVPERADKILVDEAEIARLSEQFQRTWMRPPTRQELAEDFVKEEILNREALALGLDKDDLVIRRRMRQKMEFLNAALAEQREPTDAELQAYLDANPGKFRRPARYSFRQNYLGPDVAGTERRAADLLARLQADPALGADPQALGDPTLLPPGLDSASEQEIAATFGTEFADSVSGLAKDTWRGPYPSSYGLHLIRLTGKEEGGLPELGQIRSAVAREWSNERRQEADDHFYQALRARFSVEIRLPKESADRQSLAARNR